MSNDGQCNLVDSGQRWCIASQACNDIHATSWRVHLFDMIEYRIICEEELCVASELLWAGSIETGVRTAEAMYKNTKGR